MTKVIIYTINTCEAEKVKQKMDEYNIDCEIKHVVRDGFTFAEFKSLLSLTYFGLDDLITARGNAIDELKEAGINIDELTLSEAYQCIVDNPKLLKTTILTNFERIAYGLGGAKMFRTREERVKDFKKI